MSTPSEITRLTTAKSAIRTAIRNKGVTVEDSEKIDTYAAKIDAIVEATGIVYTGSRLTPASTLGNNGDIYIYIPNIIS